MKNWKPDVWFSIVYVVVTVLPAVVKMFGYDGWTPDAGLVTVVSAVIMIINVVVGRYINEPMAYRNGWHSGYAAGSDVEK